MKYFDLQYQYYSVVTSLILKSTDQVPHIYGRHPYVHCIPFVTLTIGIYETVRDITKLKINKQRNSLRLSIDVFKSSKLTIVCSLYLTFFVVIIGTVGLASFFLILFILHFYVLVDFRIHKGKVFVNWRGAGRIVEYSNSIFFHVLFFYKVVKLN